MAPRIAGTSGRRENWRCAHEVRPSRCTTCHQLSRATIDPAVSTKTSSRKTRRPRESVRPRITGRLRSSPFGWDDQGGAGVPARGRARVLAERIKALVFRAETNDVVARCGDSNALAERQEGEDERHDDAGHHGADACRPTSANKTP